MIMTFEEAKKRSDYRFGIYELEWLIPEIRNGKFNNWDDNCDGVDGRFYNGTAVLEIGWIDIEVNITSDCKEEDGSYINKVYVSYFSCVKGKTDIFETGWCDVGYLDCFGYDVEVDWSSKDWMDQLERDMFDKLVAFCEKYDVKIDEPNFDNSDGESHEWDVFDRLNGIK